MAAPSPPLQGMGVVVTRPAHQADPLCRLIEARGGRAIRFPTLAIEPPADPGAALAALDRLEQYNLVIFTSVNAVERGFTLLGERRGWPARPPAFAVGKATARALTARGVADCRLPQQGQDSEALLALPDLQAVANQRILIVRGEGGRERLRPALEERGARVDEALVYRRVRPALPPDELLQYWARSAIHAVIVTSNESLRNLDEMVGEAGRRWLRRTPLVVVSERARSLAAQLGFERPALVAPEPGDAAIVEMLLHLLPNPLPTLTEALR